MTQIVTVDIGGTHARFAIAEIGDNGQISLGEPDTLHTKDHASFQTAWEHFKSRQGGKLPDAVAIAIAGHIGGDVIRFTNNPWILRPARIREKLGVSRYALVNDFGAVGHAVARAEPQHFMHLAGPDIPLTDDGTISVLGPGTGLGVAHVWRGPNGAYRVQATEGGHMDFAPLDSIEDAILARLRKRHDRVSVERVVAGPAIVSIYQTLAAMEGRAIADQDDLEIWTRGMSSQDTLAGAAVDRFCLSLGSIAGDIALAQGGFGGVVIAGGLGYRIRDTLLSSGFAERFRAKGRFERLMSDIPVKLIIHPQPGLFGAAAAFAKEHFA
ncbi:glucokinase [Altererythrobacter aquiaggeris]|uniref:glucokinase n=1 Tax=Aestuarierythrobacter aquiaggeris TaxID=1898396 RepID=UPI00301B24CB